jgi:hypothetical protein
MAGESLRHTAQLFCFFGEGTVVRDLGPPRSPDLNLPDCFVWGFIKKRVYLNNPRNLEKMKRTTGQNAEYNGPETLGRIAKTPDS